MKKALAEKFKQIRKKAQSAGFDLYFAKSSGGKYDYIFSVIDGDTACYNTSTIADVEKYISENKSTAEKIRNLREILNGKGYKLFYLSMPDGEYTCRLANADGEYRLDQKFNTLSDLVDAVSDIAIPKGE